MSSPPQPPAQAADSSSSSSAAAAAVAAAAAAAAAYSSYSSSSSSSSSSSAAAAAARTSSNLKRKREDGDQSENRPKRRNVTNLSPQQVRDAISHGRHRAAIDAALASLAQGTVPRVDGCVHTCGCQRHTDYTHTTTATTTTATTSTTSTTTTTTTIEHTPYPLNQSIIDGWSRALKVEQQTALAADAEELQTDHPQCDRNCLYHLLQYILIQYRRRSYRLSGTEAAEQLLSQELDGDLLRQVYDIAVKDYNKRLSGSSESSCEDTLVNSAKKKKKKKSTKH